MVFKSTPVYDMSQVKMRDHIPIMIIKNRLNVPCALAGTPDATGCGGKPKFSARF